jgi:hypothetical protein
MRAEIVLVVVVLVLDSFTSGGDEARLVFGKRQFSRLRAR